MACPYFYPVSKAEVEKQPARVPLGSLYQGTCEIGGTASSDACNFGYAAGRCDAFPQDAPADAVRFTTLQGRTIYVLEKDFSPVRYGDAATLDGALARQAEVFAAWMGQ
jgi:hypothetical protein